MLQLLRLDLWESMNSAADEFGWALHPAAVAVATHALSSQLVNVIHALEKMERERNVSYLGLNQLESFVITLLSITSHELSQRHQLKT